MTIKTGQYGSLFGSKNRVTGGVEWELVSTNN